jgi:hypothetical protein
MINCFSPYLPNGKKTFRAAVFADHLFWGYLVMHVDDRSVRSPDGNHQTVKEISAV